MATGIDNLQNYCLGSSRGKSRLLRWLSRWLHSHVHLHGENDWRLHSSCLSFRNRPFAQLWPGNEVRGIAGQNRLRCVCFSFELSFFFHFGMSLSDQCCVPRCSNRGMAIPSLLSLSFQWSSEPQGALFYLPFDRLTDSLRTSNSTVVCMGSTSSLRKMFAFMLVPKSLLKQVLLNTMHSAHIITNKTNENGNKRK